jgi:hypothetical protein
MLVVDKRLEGEKPMPVQPLPMPPVEVQRPDPSGNAVFYPQKPAEEAPRIPQIGNLIKV